MGIIKRNVISTELNDYTLAILGESGIGKTTLMKETCEKLFGEDGYAIFNMGREEGVDAIENASYVDIPTWKHFAAACKDIVENKDTEYPNLKVVVFDTLDECIALTEPEAIRQWNILNQGVKDFKEAKTLNGAWSGFGRGEQKVTDMILEKIAYLKQAGVRVWWTAHSKSRDIVDPLTNATYTTISTKMQTSYFTGFKTKAHVVGIACVDRTIETESTGRKNIVTKQDITVNKVKEERRKIIFRDDNYGVDSKSRFSGIVSEIALETDEFISAIKNAISASKSGSEGTKPSAKKKSTPKKEEPAPTEDDIFDNPEVETEPTVEDTPLEEAINPPVEEEDDFDLFADEEPASDYPEDLMGEIRKLITKADEEKKLKATEIIKPFGTMKNCEEDVLRKVYDILSKE